MGLVVYISTNSEFELTKAGFPRWQATFNLFHYLSMNQKSFYKDRGCVHYVIVSTVQWEPFQPATQLYIHKMIGWVAKSCERWRMRTGLICGKQMREQQDCFNKKEKKMDLVSSLLYNCLSSYSSWGMTVGLTQKFWRKWLLGPLDKLVKTVWEKKSFTKLV